MPELFVLQHHDEDDAGLIGDAFLHRGFTLTIFRIREEADLPAGVVPDAVLVLGSKEAVYDAVTRPRWVAAELAFLTRMVAQSVPLLGICFGAQELCLLAGGSVAPAPTPEVGWYAVTSNDPFWRGPWFQYHFDACQPSDHMEVLGVTAAGPQAFWWHNNLGVQFHPEIDERQLRAWMDAGDDVRDVGLDPSALLTETRVHEPDAQKRATELVTRFCERNGL